MDHTKLGCLIRSFNPQLGLDLAVHDLSAYNVDEPMDPMDSTTTTGRLEQCLLQKVFFVCVPKAAVF